MTFVDLLPRLVAALFGACLYLVCDYLVKTFRKVLARKESTPAEKREAYAEHMTQQGKIAPLTIHHEIRIKGWNCRQCRCFNGEEHSIHLVCRSCDAPRPL